MGLSISVPQHEETEIRPKITVIGVGGAGCNAVNNMIRAQLEGVDFVVCNTDAQSLQQSLATRRIQLGAALTRGLGAGAKPDIGRAAGEEAIEEIVEQLSGSNMVFITAGMGGGTGTGAAPVLARAAREHGILTVGVVTKPFQFEGAHRMRLAESGINELQNYVDTLIVIPNQNLFRLANERTTFAEAFNMADNVLHQGVRGVTDLMIMPGLINLDFADIRAVMSEMGKAMMGTGEAEGARRALDAAEAAISNPLLEDTSMKGARGVLINVTGGLDMTLFEVDEAANRIRDEVDPDANIIFGSTFDASLDGRMRVSVVATGIDAEAQAGRPRPGMPTPSPAISLVSEHGRPPLPRAPIGGGGGGGGGGMPLSVAIAASVTAAGPQTQPTLMSGETVYQTVGSSALAAHSDTDVLPQQVMAEPAAPLPTPASSPAPAARPSVAQLTAAAIDGPFIAPPPVDAASVRVHASQPDAPAHTDPAQTNAAKPRAPSLFERVTGGRHRQAAPAPAASQVRPERPQPASQPRLGQLDPADRLAGSQNEDDLLDIPAFLRRQAN